jgi:hypothetical protein
MAAALLLGLTGPALAQPRPTYGQGDGLIGGLFVSHKTDVKPGEKAGEPAPTAAPKGPAPAAARAILDREQQILLRRQQVCDRLRELALEAGNAEMAQQSEQLSQQAFAVFQERTAGLAAVVAEEKDKAARPARTLPPPRRAGEERAAREDQ